MTFINCSIKKRTYGHNSRQSLTSLVAPAVTQAQERVVRLGAVFYGEFWLWMQSNTFFQQIIVQEHISTTTYDRALVESQVPNMDNETAKHVKYWVQ